MAFLAPHSDPDAFISYSHGDPRGLGASPLKEWTHRLIERLQAQIESLEDRFDGLDIGFDRNLDPTAQPTDAPEARVGASGIIVMSKRHLSPSWRKDEPAWFRTQCQDRAGRVFALRAQQTDAALWPDFLPDERGQAMTGFAFCDPATGLPPIWENPVAPGPEFVRGPCRLLTALIRRLRESRERAAVAGEAAAMFNLGILCKRGVGVAQDCAKALNWMRKVVTETESQETGAAGKPGPRTARALDAEAWRSLCAKDFQGALAVAERAPEVDPNNLVVKINRAHALMFLNRTDEARAIYHSHRDEKIAPDDSRAWRQAVLDDFASFRKAGLTNPLMAEIEAAFAKPSPEPKAP